MIQLGLVGYPLGHSHSPQIHKAALTSCGLKGDYSLFPIHPDDRQALKDMLDRVRSGEVTGLNVTIPHKQTIIPLLEELTPTAKTIGAVNTIFVRNKKLTGDNTDALGFLADLERFIGNRKSETRNQQASVKQKLALVLGAGGSAHAIVHALINGGWMVSISARRIKQTQELIARIQNSDSQVSSVEYHPTALKSLLTAVSIVVNTTPLGMAPNIGTSPWLAGLPFPKNAAIYDLVYNPGETRLVRDARSAGLRATAGLGMLIEQAALAFEIWTGCNPPRDILFQAARATQPD